MKVSRGLPRSPGSPHPVLTIGNFDGQHIGHQHLLASVVQYAREQRGTPMVVTFDPHPVVALRPGAAFKFLTSPSDKLAWFEAQGVEHLVVLNFSNAFAALSPEEFVCSILKDGLGVKVLCVGERFVFGKDRAGTLETLHGLAAQAHFQVQVVTPVCCQGIIVSSTRIRQCVGKGEMERAEAYLGRPYSLAGVVVAGDRRGQALGYPTANLHPPGDRVMPPDGVYATKMIWRDKVFPSVSYIGTRPTFGDGERVLEVHVLDEACALYGEWINVQFLHYIRGDEVFDDAERLAARMAQDIQSARQAFAE